MFWKTNKQNGIRRKPDQESLLPLSLYQSDNYFSKKVLYSQVEQIIWTKRLNPLRVLEIGPGNGFTSSALRLLGIDVDTVDVNPNLSPTYCCSILDLNKIGIPNNYDVVLCAEVLEHLPFYDFSAAIFEISKMTKCYAVITLPRCQRVLLSLDFSIKFYRMRRMHAHFFLYRKSKKIGKEHQWEINSSKETNIKYIKLVFENYFNVVEDKIFPYHPKHHFFLLKIK